MFDIKAQTEKILKDCIIKSNTDVNLYTPDGKRNYGSLWTRDFAYMVEYASDLIPDEDIENAIEYLLNAADQNGWIPDRVGGTGRMAYTAGGPDFPASPNLDNGPFIILCVNSYLKTVDPQKAEAMFLKWKDALCRGIDCLPVNEKGLILNVAEPPHSPYGFTDTVSKQGELAFESLLLWRAQKELSSLLLKYGFPCEKYLENLKRLEDSFEITFLQDNGMLKAATKVCAQTDVWGSCYAVSIGFPLSKNVKKSICSWLCENYNGVVHFGQLRQLPANEYWEKTFVEVKEGTYQNGAYWATPIVWLYDALKEFNKPLADKTFEDIMLYFEKYGIFECVNGEDRKLETYVVSATNTYGLYKKLFNSNLVNLTNTN